ncbi:LLM class flavin-dependent oxidoreductase [Beijerinckia indica]|uniref:Alkanesulfonate monooxygenase n=1 Tax=Beijerinckia indica subsp. indica (strain ATCC 9039 / DSM 1715 / NCIMB 8712) TaxID=395963 RepID=B2IJF1_BEII9|nr:LLM class flavin-dependent oxidoreductase [Beijerinckia indica]ACB96264.1 Alkanesulfonate monooxygenase [Beijerinckia indica subsp. indica ATCC 9039]
MGVKFIGYIGFNNTSELHNGVRHRILDRDYVNAAAKAQEAGGFDRVLIPFGSNTPESQIVAAHAAAITTTLGFLVAHRPGFTQPTLAARQLATLDQLSNGRVAVHIITGGADDEMARDGDVGTTKAERYARTDEYLTVLKEEWNATQPFDHSGRFYQVRGALSAIHPTNLPIFFGGTSAEAIDVAGRHAEVYATWGETLEATREIVARVKASAARYGREVGFSLSLRPVIAETEEKAWRRADDIVAQVRANREALGLPISGHQPPNDGSRRLLETASRARQDTRLWTGVAQLTGAQGNSTGLVGTPEQVAHALLDYYDIGIDHFLIRGFEPLDDAIAYGRDLIPLVRELVAERDSRRLAVAS